MSTSNQKKLRSQQWWGQPNYESFTRRAWLRAEGFTAEVFQNKPVIGICNSWSELNNCNAHLLGDPSRAALPVTRAGDSVVVQGPASAPDPTDTVIVLAVE